MYNQDAKAGHHRSDAPGTRHVERHIDSDN